MQILPNRCPICGETAIAVTRFDCHQCDSAIEGRFTLPRLQRLTPEQLLFAEIFLINEGKINRVEQEMGLSYSAVRARLDEIVEALGGHPAGDNAAATPGRDHPPISQDRRKEILARVSAGEISAGEAAELLRAAG